MSALLTLQLHTSLLAATDTARYRDWILAMKEAPRGPFKQIRWFCNDGTLLPPNPNACNEHGGGAQHGEWTDQVKAMREDGFLVANILANIDTAPFNTDPSAVEKFAQITLEQFLIAIDDGWILRRARYYRGAMQEEGERRGARRMLFKMAESRDWFEQRYVMLRTGARMIAHGPETDLVTLIRQISTDLARQDPEFQLLRNKIHIRPDASDADAVRAYARRRSSTELNAQFEKLAEAIHNAHRPAALVEHLERVAKLMQGVGDLGEILTTARERFASSRDAGERFSLSAELLMQLRERMAVPNGPERRLALIDTSLKLEAEHFTAGTLLRERLAGASRREILDWLLQSTAAIYGSGLVSRRQYQALVEDMQLLSTDTLSLQTYKHTLDYLARTPGWGTSSLAQYYGDAMQQFARIEPLSMLFIQDQLRGSALFFYAQALEILQRDADRLAGVRNDLYGERTGGMRGLNPGLARGKLYFALSPGVETEFDRNGIYVLHETISELPPVAGIITAGEGNPLSHVQLLARNLGIPNVAITDNLIERLRAHSGEQILLAASPAGSVVIRREDPDRSTSDDPHQPAVTIRPDLEKLDLSFRGFPGLQDLGAEDSGRIVGPKAAKLAELRHHFPEAVSAGLVIPFGEFRALLRQPKAGTDTSVFDWIVGEYKRLARLPTGSAERAQQTESFRQVLESWVLHADPGEDFRERLRLAMQTTFGADGSYGVFVRSDTNVEDLPGFTGAGLNLTVPNVVGFDAILEAINRVWASPFSARAFAWRQALMSQPQHVYPAVLLQLTVPVEKSGVLVTRDIDTGNDGWLSIAVNEGVGGAVDGQPAESLRVELATGRVRLLAQASTPWRRTAPLTGGVVRVPVSGSNVVLQAEEIAQLIGLARTLPERYPPILDDYGQPAPADIEFGFIGGKLRLFQLRPFLESVRARTNAYLAELDSGLADIAAIKISLKDQPTQ